MERHLIVGLGNPGKKYEGTRHNAGFMALDMLASRHQVTVGTKKFKGVLGTGFVGNRPVVLLKPQTFMNVSGASVQPAAAFYSVPPERIIVLHDELDLETGVMKVKSGGGHGGHNGLRDIIAKLGGAKDFARVRLGIGRPSRGDVTGWVLGGYGKSEIADRDDAFYRACDAVEAIVDRGVGAAQNEYNGG